MTMTTTTRRPQRRRHRRPLRHARRRQGQPRHRQVPVPGHQHAGSAAPTTVDDPRLLRRQQEMTHAQPFDASTPTTPPCSSAPTTARRRSSTCCTPWPPASPPASPTSPRPAASPSPRSTRPSRATSTCSASSALDDRGPQRLPADPGQLQAAGRRPGEAAPGRRAVAARSAVFDMVTNGVPVVDRRRRRLTPSSDPAGPADAAEPAGPASTVRTVGSTRCAPPTPSSSAPARPAWPSAAASPTAAVDHVVLERGRIAERWRSETLGLAAPAHPELDDPPARAGPTTAPTPTGS